MLTAWAMGAAIVLSAPYAQQAFSAIDQRWPERSETIVLSAAVLPAVVALIAALLHIRYARLRRYGLVALGLGVGLTYYFAVQPIFTEAFHFAEYGVVTILFYRAWRDVSDWSRVVLPVLAGAIVGVADEWFQWFIPVRAGELNDVGINALAAVGGVLFSIAVWPPRTSSLPRESALRLVRWGGAMVVALAAFFYTVHVGGVVSDAEIGGFRSRFSGAELLEASEIRSHRWKVAPPVEVRRLSREDQYLAEGLWRVGRRNEYWSTGNIGLAWRENRILEKFYSPVLSTPTHADPKGHAWPAEQRAEAEGRLPDGPFRVDPGDDYPYRLYTWAELF